jgi:hypothetical protein
MGGGVVSERFSEGHGQTLPRKNKSAMPKIILAIRRQCRHITRMSKTKQHLGMKYTIRKIGAKHQPVLILSSGRLMGELMATKEAAQARAKEMIQAEAKLMGRSYLRTPCGIYGGVSYA